jgi:pyruvate/2-oxoglutarate dehydrogenase complex dihydrolipoamide dehydrogenase (E3) component
MLNCHYVIIGSGETGIRLALQLAETGKQVVLVEQEDQLGGTFVHNYDIPKGLLRAQAKVFRGSLKIFKDYKETFSVLRKKRKLIADAISDQSKKTSDELRSLFKKYENTQLIIGQAHFFSKSIVEVDADKDKYLITFNQCLLTPGLNSLKAPQIKGLEKISLLHQYNAFLFAEIPTRLAILGVSRESLEVASYYSGLGVKVQIFEKRTPQSALSQLDRTAMNFLIKSLSLFQVEFFFKTSVESVKKDGKSLILTDSNKETYKVSHVYTDLEQKFDGKQLNLTKAGVKYSVQGIEASSSGSTTVKGILVFGPAQQGYSRAKDTLRMNSYIDREQSKYKKTHPLLAPFKLLNLNSKKPTVFDQFTPIDCLDSVSTLGQTEVEAVRKHGSSVKAKIFVSDSYSGVVKCVYYEPLDQLLGVTMTSELDEQFRSLMLEYLQSKTKFSVVSQSLFLRDLVLKSQQFVKG